MPAWVQHNIFSSHHTMMPDLGFSVKTVLWSTYFSVQLNSTMLVAARCQTMVQIAVADTPTISQLGTLPSTATRCKVNSHASSDCL